MVGDGVGGGGNFFFLKGVWGIFLFLYGGGGGKDLSKESETGLRPESRVMVVAIFGSSAAILPTSFRNTTGPLSEWYQIAFGIVPTPFQYAGCRY